MNDKETFGVLLRATERLSRPWKTALVLTNLLWAVAFLVRAIASSAQGNVR